MAIDLAPLITGDTYPDVVPSPEDGEVITESALIDLGVALGDRIEYVRLRTPEATTSPESSFFLRDDFYGGDYVSPNYYGEHTWNVTDGAGFTQGLATASLPNNPGVWFATIPTTDTWAMSLKGTSIAGIRMGNIDQLVIVAGGITSNVADSEVFFGLATTVAAGGTGNSAVGLWFDEATDANWLSRHKVGGVDDATPSGVAFASNTFVVYKLVRISATQMEVYINGTLVETLTHGTTLPAASALVNVGAYGVGGSAATMTPVWDLITLRCTTDSRQT